MGARQPCDACLCKSAIVNDRKSRRIASISIKQTHGSFQRSIFIQHHIKDSVEYRDVVFFSSIGRARHGRAGVCHLFKCVITFPLPRSGPEDNICCGFYWIYQGFKLCGFSGSNGRDKKQLHGSNYHTISIWLITAPKAPCHSILCTRQLGCDYPSQPALTYIECISTPGTSALFRSWWLRASLEQEEQDSHYGVLCQYLVWPPTLE